MKFKPAVRPDQVRHLPAGQQGRHARGGRETLPRPAASTSPANTTPSRRSASATPAMDEIGTPFCVTIDGDTLKDQTVTVRERDTMKPERVSLDKVLRVPPGAAGRVGLPSLHWGGTDIPVCYSPGRRRAVLETGGTDILVGDVRAEWRGIPAPPRAGTSCCFKACTGPLGGQECPHSRPGNRQECLFHQSNARTRGPVTGKNARSTNQMHCPHSRTGNRQECPFHQPNALPALADR